ncbi:glycoside hydrolase [Acidithrix sp. C25]|uniref:glycoside hydrolase n=1 Tax=Acidithrix sp. C25 TaxID=1671482 RepID=UPI00191B8FA9|nr:glycoside hydrolase [Acidithrix sp. C25]CAG4924204.1 unnamed protein product [Acidithrix sp. C25]
MNAQGQENSKWLFADLKSVSKSLRVTLVVTTIFFLSLGLVRVSQLIRGAPVVPNAVVSPTKLQKIAGFGASGAWWSGPVYSMPKSSRLEVGKLLFSSKGLQMSQFRYNVGGGGVGVTTSWKAPPTFLNANGSYNFNNDPAGTYFLKMAKAYHVQDLVAFVNSAPPIFTSNHLSCRGFLSFRQVAPYARYLTHVVVGLKKHLGIDVSYLSPMNEPDFSMAPCKQEGMRVPVPVRALLVSTLGKDLAKSAPWCHIIADESSQIAFQLIPEVSHWVHHLNAIKYIAAFAHHSYDYPGPQVLSDMKSVFARLGLNSWMTEICCFNGKRFGYQYDPTMVSGMWLAKSIFNDLFYGGDSAFDWWTALSPNIGCQPNLSSGCASNVNILGRNDGLVYYDINYPNDHNYKFYLTKRYYVFGNFSKFMPIGSVLHGVVGLPNGIEAIASQKLGSWSVVLIDDRSVNSPTVKIKIALPTQFSSSKVVSSALTSARSSWAKISNASMAQNVLTFNSAPQSVSSVMVSPTPIR